MARHVSEAAPVTGGEIQDTWFLDGGVTGYLASEVDELLRQVAAELDAGRPARPLIENTTFRSGRGKKGYDVDAVDWFLDQLLLPQDHGETGETSADPWRDIGDVAQLVRGGVSGLAQRYPPPQKPTQRKAERWFAGECENAWRDFGKQPGVQLWWGRAEARWELRTADEQALAFLQGGGPIHSMQWGRVPPFRAPLERGPNAVSVGGRRLTFRTKGRVRSSSQVIGEIAARSARDAAGHFAEPESRQRKPSVTEVTELVDEAGIPMLYISGENYHWRAGFCISFPDGRWLRFPVRGTRRANAIMTAVDQAGNTVARYRINDKGFNLLSKTPLRQNTVEVTINPDRKLTDELVLAIAISAREVSTYFIVPEG